MVHHSQPFVASPMAARTLICRAITMLVGLAFSFGPLFTHRDLSLLHIGAHILTGPTITGLALYQIVSSRKRLPPRHIDGLLVILGLWLAALPFVIPAPGLHVHAHVLAGLLVAGFSAWNVWAK